RLRRLHTPMLRARRKRPCGCRAAEQRDELAPLHSITSSARASSIGGASRPSAFAALVTDDKFKLCRLLNRPILRLCSSPDAIDRVRSAPEEVDVIHSVGQQATFKRNITDPVDRRDLLLCGLLNYGLTVNEHAAVCHDHKPTARLVCERTWLCDSRCMIPPRF